MPGIDRRLFLQGTGMLTAGALTSKLRAYASELAAASHEESQDNGVLSPPVFEPFEWAAPGMVFSFEFLDRESAPERCCRGDCSAKGYSAPTAISGSRRPCTARARIQTTIMA